jgi:glycosyltransferase involved in cell wall biosynthesis
MIRVGFVMVPAGTEWIGGVNYYINLLNAIATSQRIQPVILTGATTARTVAGEFPAAEIVKSRLLDPTGKSMLARRIAEKLYGRAFALEHLLRAHNIDVLSHSGNLGRRSKFPTIGWIPDFQHVHLPEFFSAKDRRKRDAIFSRIVDYCTLVIVSSEDARRDLLKFKPQASRKAHVLHFVPGFSNAPGEPESRQHLLARYGIEGPYFHLPNQFWAHKNHAVVIDALGRARAMGRPLSVVATGKTEDYRNPEHFKLLMRRAADSGCQDDFRPLGLVPFADVAALMRYSVAAINPSMFEGWSTTVEESKSLGKTIILSDIPVHREQAPDYGIYFNPGDPEQLAGLMIEVLSRFSIEREAAQTDQARAELPRRITAFAAAYENIALEAATTPY